MEVIYCNSKSGYNVYNFYTKESKETSINIFSNSLCNAMNNYMSGWTDNEPSNIISSDTLIDIETEYPTFFVIDDKVKTNRTSKYVICEVTVYIDDKRPIVLYIIVQNSNVYMKRVSQILESEKFKVAKEAAFILAFGSNYDILNNFIKLESIDYLYVELPVKTEQSDTINIEHINDAKI